MSERLRMSERFGMGARVRRSESSRPSEPSSPQPTDVAVIDLRVDELILHGFRPTDRHAIAAAIERELGRLFSDGGVPAALLNRDPARAELAADRVNAGAFDVPHDASPDAVGVRVARAIHQSLGGAPGSDQRANPGSSRTPGLTGAGR